MAVNRSHEQPKCFKCGELIDGKYRDQSDVNWDRMFVGDTFQGWDFEGHHKECKGSMNDFLSRQGDGEYRLVKSGERGYIHPLGRDGETYDFSVHGSSKGQ